MHSRVVNNLHQCLLRVKDVNMLKEESINSLPTDATSRAVSSELKIENSFLIVNYSQITCCLATRNGSERRGGGH